VGVTYLPPRAGLGLLWAENSLFNYIPLPLVFEVAEDNPIKFELSACPPDFQQQYRELLIHHSLQYTNLMVLDVSGSEILKITFVAQGIAAGQINILQRTAVTSWDGACLTLITLAEYF
jgi:hypothetical protein